MNRSHMSRSSNLDGRASRAIYVALMAAWIALMLLNHTY